MTDQRAGRQTTREDAMGAREGLEPGCIMVHLGTGTAVSLKRRKDDDSGWWNTDGSGLADSVIEDGSWVPADGLLAEVERLMAERDALQAALERVAWTIDPEDGCREFALVFTVLEKVECAEIVQAVRAALGEGEARD